MIYEGTDSEALRFLPKKDDCVSFGEDVLEDTELEGHHRDSFRCLGRKWQYSSGSLFVEIELSMMSALTVVDEE